MFWIVLAFSLIPQTVFCQEQTLRVSSQFLDFGHGKTEKNIYLTNQGQDHLSWKASTVFPWINISPSEGEILSYDTYAPDAPYYHSLMLPQQHQIPNLWYVISPESVGIDHEGNIYVVDAGSTPIKKYNKYEEFLFEITGPNTPDEDNYLLYPIHIAFDSQNNFYVTDAAIVKKFNRDGHFLSRLTMMVNGQPVNYDAYDIAVDTSDNVYVTDRNSYCVHKFDENGNYLKSWGSRGMGQGQFESFSRKLGIVVDSQNYVYVADNHYERIQKFDSEGNFILSWGNSTYIEESQFGEAFAIDSHDILYVGHEDSGFLHKFDGDGNLVPFQEEPPQWFALWEFAADLSVASSGDIYMSGYDRTVMKFDPNGQLLKTFKSHSQRGQGTFYWPVGMTVNKEGNIYVRDENEHIFIFNPNGELLSDLDISSIPNNPINIISFTAMAVDQAGNIYLGQDNFIIKLNSQGQYVGINYYEDYDISKLAFNSQGFLYALTSFPLLLKLDASGNVIEELNLRTLFLIVEDFAFDSLDNIYLPDPLKGIFKLNPAGQVLAQFAYAPHTARMWAKNMGNLFNIAVDPQDNFYILSKEYADIQKYDSNGNLLVQWGQGGTSEGQMILTGLTGGGYIFTGKNNDVIVSEHGNNRIQIFSQAVAPLNISIDRSQLRTQQNVARVNFSNESNPLEPFIPVAISAEKEFLLNYKDVNKP
ncbi:MAG: hypothetical protein HY606_03765 [Planctomycetes bacterium]|nr:hypothetical protein [Planctomycetota bacterium]